MTIKQFIRTYEYQEGTDDDLISFYVDTKKGRYSMTLYDWEQQPYFLVTAKIKFFSAGVTEEGRLEFFFTI